MRRIIACAVLALMLCGCVDLLNATIPSNGYAIERDIPYAEGARRSLDIYRPENPATGSPVILFYYGGRWETRRKEDYLFAAQAFVAQGFTVVIADYRLYPNVRFPLFLEDAAKAFVWTHNNIARY